MQRRELPYAEAYVFTHDQADVVQLLDAVADFIEQHGGTLFSITYQNSLDGGYHESLTVTLENDNAEIVKLPNGITVKR